MASRHRLSRGWRASNEAGTRSKHKPSLLEAWSAWPNSPDRPLEADKSQDACEQFNQVATEVLQTPSSTCQEEPGRRVLGWTRLGERPSEAPNRRIEYERTRWGIRGSKASPKVMCHLRAPTRLTRSRSGKKGSHQRKSTPTSSPKTRLRTRPLPSLAAQSTLSSRGLSKVP